MPPEEKIKNFGAPAKPLNQLIYWVAAMGSATAAGAAMAGAAASTAA
jgi:hypothetical protein